jgi:hypothetical protein
LRRAFAKDIHREIHIAVSLGQGLLAVHHPGAGHLAKFRNGSSSDFSHINKGSPSR